MKNKERKVFNPINLHFVTSRLKKKKDKKDGAREKKCLLQLNYSEI